MRYVSHILHDPQLQRSHHRSLFFAGEAPGRSWASLTSVARRKLDMLDASVVLSDLRIPPNNRLELLKGDRQGRYSIRINDQWRLCFRWTPNSPEEVEVVDYH